MGRFHPHGDHDRHHDGDHDHGHDHHDHDRDVGDHGGYETASERVMVLQNILGENERIAEQNRSDFAEHGVRTINLMSSPGAGKTTLLARIIPELSAKFRVGIIEGDIATSIDADTLTGLGARVALVNTADGFGGECHLDAVMVRAGIDQLTLDDLDLLVIENVGNLVCPAEFDVGQDERVMVYAITEGEEKPLKYPVMFRSVDAVVINKMDLLPHLDFDMDLFLSNLEQINPGVRVFEISARTGDGIPEFLAWAAR
jgi:hydrogenase nickel incorporation protein HypB